ncbi:hypothetical protein FW778_14250 [Ginsengibacter hankyongi]|uniref:Uncharacterized protein n=1 Tax=Ginsengibacter hankyongi TaxID=2607284 RepID=A0A5J5IGB4_9BACT|nr:hypothetical protein [Ginsengibacter hankyongi]KAA9038704.1 hypothetical protein FW778_14250 [Ginsengibacter hankyongi]
MLTNISWKEYSIFILVIIFCYYVILILVFYRNDIINLIKDINYPGRKRVINIDSHLADQDEKDLVDLDIDSRDIINQVQQEIRSNLEKAKSKSFIREEIMQSLQLVLKNNSTVKRIQQQEAINNYIRMMCESICSIHLSKEEINQLWIR